MRASPIYSPKFLLDDLFRAATMMKRDEYVYFHADMLKQVDSLLSFDKLSVNILHLNDEFFPDGEITSAVAYVPGSIIDSYQKHLLGDDFTPLTFSQPGSVMFADALRPMESWMEKPIYRHHCTPYDYHWVVGVGYRYPHQKLTFVAIHYAKGVGEPFSDELDEFSVEYLTYPFYLGWLHQYGAICDRTLFHWLDLLTDMPPARFRVLRGLAESGVFHTGVFARNIGSSTKSVYRHMENAFEVLRSKDNGIPEFNNNANRLLALSRAYGFFEFGAGCSQGRLPCRNLQTG